MATSSWRIEDLQQLEELGLAGQLESTRLQEAGGEGSGCNDESGWYTMRCVSVTLFLFTCAQVTWPAFHSNVA